jgi:Flp pilus assembly pilin Flp
MNRVKRLVRNQEGQELLEYALLVALIVLIVIGATTMAGPIMKEVYHSFVGLFK